MHFAPGGPQTAHDESGHFFYGHPRAGKWRPARVVRGDREPQQRNIMAKLKSLEVLLQQEIKDLYSAENQLVKALPKMAKAATSPELREAFETHLEETKVHAERLEEVAKLLETTPKGKVCKAMQGLVEEGSEVIEEDGEGSVKDLALIGAAQKVEHYEIAGYGTARALAEALGLDEVVELLQTTLDEEGTTDKLLTGLAEDIVPMALEGASVE
jgi:ferritin-like metal-binding protein YciE